MIKEINKLNDNITPTIGPRVSIVIASWNARELLIGCLRSIGSAEPSLRYQVIVVDNGSTDGSAEAITQLYPETTLIRNPVNKGYAGATNQGIAAATAEYLLLLNNDTEIRPGAISYLADFMDRNPDVGVASCHTIYPDGGLQYPARCFPGIRETLLDGLCFGRLLPRGLRARLMRGGYWDHGQDAVVDWLIGSALMIRTSAAAEVGGLSEELFMYGEDMEYSHRMRCAGWLTAFTPGAQIVHFGSSTSRRKMADVRQHMTFAKYFYYRRWHGPVACAVFRAMQTLAIALRVALIETGRYDRLYHDRDAVRRTYRNELFYHLRSLMPSRDMKSQ